MEIIKKRSSWSDWKNTPEGLQTKVVTHTRLLNFPLSMDEPNVKLHME